MIPLADTTLVVDAFIRGQETTWDRSYVLMSRHSGLDIPELDHVRESIMTILTTRIGSRVCQRTFGAMLLDLLDGPVTEVTPASVAYIVGVACQWEPRIIVHSVELAPASDITAGSLVFSLFFTYVINGEAVALHGLQIDRNQIV
jgi:hypothetical protein